MPGTALHITPDGVEWATPPPVGDCIVVNLYDERRIRVERADPRIWVAQQFLDATHHPDISIIDDVITINAVNQRVVYRINRTWTLPDADCWLAEWPD